jgi:hypothetical protein
MPQNPDGLRILDQDVGMECSFGRRGRMIPRGLKGEKRFDK